MVPINHLPSSSTTDQKKARREDQSGQKWATKKNSMRESRNSDRMQSMVDLTDPLDEPAEQVHHPPDSDGW